jgi:hypothetical protein
VDRSGLLLQVGTTMTLNLTFMTIDPASPRSGRAVGVE